jgi:glycolate oxidase
VNDLILKELSGKLKSPDNLILDLTDYDDYFHDASTGRGTPSAIVFAECEADVLAVVNFCTKNKIPVVSRGAGTGLSGGCVPVNDAIVLSLERMVNLRIDPKIKTAFAEAGVITKTLLDKSAEYNLTYPPDPASYKESTLGGNVAENAGGLRCKRYGVTRDYVIGIKGVTMDGKIIRTGVYEQKHGFNFEDVFIGSEGTLVIITEMAFRLIALPEIGDTVLAAFDNQMNGAQTVADICGSGIIPTVLEFLDGDAVECSNKYEKYDGLDNAEAILIIEIDSEDTDSVEKICEKNQCSYIRKETDFDKAENIWQVRRNMSYAVEDIAKFRISEDVAVPISKFPVLVEFVNKMNGQSSLRINSFGHAGDGNLHVNFLSMTGSEQEKKLIDEEILKLLKKTIELGGTLSGEHGIGLSKKRYLSLEFDKSTLDSMKKVKNIFDFENLLNPGKIF